jgi:hypothetical protein
MMDHPHYTTELANSPFRPPGFSEQPDGVEAGAPSSAPR